MHWKGLADMETKAQKNAQSLMSEEIFKEVLDSADSPLKRGQALTLQLRNLIGGKAVVFVQLKSEQGQEFIVEGVSPERKMSWIQNPLFANFIDRHRKDIRANLVTFRKADPNDQHVLTTLGIQNFLIVPINCEGENYGLLVFWGLVNTFGLDGLISYIKKLSPYIGAIINGHGNQCQKDWLN